MQGEFNVSGLNHTSCLVIGAGIAGLLAAQSLKQRGVAVAVIDKGHGVGGRLATRRIGEGVFDHGAQFFTVRDEVFQKHVDEWMEAGVVREWCRGFADASGSPHTDGHPRYCGTRGMTAIAKHIAASLDVRTGTRVTCISLKGKEWEVETDVGAAWRARALLLTPPAPQSIALLDSGEFRLDDETRARLEKITYDPCIALMTSFSDAETLPEPGALQIEGGEPIYWIADNNRKGISPQRGAITIHAGAAWSRAHWETSDEEIASILTKHAMEFLRLSSKGSDEVRAWQVKRWRYSKPMALHDERCIVAGAHRLAFAGDAFGAPRIEGAALSGLAAAERLAGMLL